MVVPWRDEIVLTRLWRRSDRLWEPALKPMPPTVVVYRCNEPLSQTAAPNPSRMPRQKRVRICRLYAAAQPQPLAHAKALLDFIQEECPEFVGGYVPHQDLDRFYRRDLCSMRGWTPLHWTAVARQMGKFTEKKMLRLNGERFVGYRIPKARLVMGRSMGK
jgi:hypothetical protein